MEHPTLILAFVSVFQALMPMLPLSDSTYDLVGLIGLGAVAE